MTKQATLWVVYESEPYPSRWHSDYVRGYPVHVISRHRTYGAATRRADRIRRRGRSPIAVDNLDAEVTS